MFESIIYVPETNEEYQSYSCIDPAGVNYGGIFHGIETEHDDDSGYFSQVSYFSKSFVWVYGKRTLLDSELSDRKSSHVQTRKEYVLTKIKKDYHETVLSGTDLKLMHEPMNTLYVVFNGTLDSYMPQALREFYDHLEEKNITYKWINDDV